MPPVVVVGAGLAGLAAARRLAEAGTPVRVLERDTAVGGRVQTDEVDGFRLDRGFQVLLTAYPECHRVLDYPALDLRAFEPGARIRHRGRWVHVTDPFRRPLAAVRSLGDRFGTWRDRLGILALRRRALRGSPTDPFERPARSTREHLAEVGFSPTFTTAFLEPWLGGIFLGRDLGVSSRVFEFVFRMLSTGDTALPREGMGAIPGQLAARLPAGTIRLGQHVAAVAPRAVQLVDGSRVEAAAVVVATEGDEAHRLLGLPAPPPPRQAISLHFGAPRPPQTGPTLMLNGGGHGPINAVVVPTELSAALAPPGQALVHVSCLAPQPDDDTALHHAVLAQAREWFGAEVDTWTHLRTDRIRWGHPDQSPDRLEPVERPVRHASGCYLAGDHLETASIHGALHSGRRAADAVLADRFG